MAQNNLTPSYRLLVIGGSAGSVRVLIDAIPFVRKNIDLAIILVLHRKNVTDNNLLVDLLTAKTPLPVKEVEEKDAITPGTFYIAPPDYHVLIENEHTISLDVSEKVNFSRPSIDVTFESAARVYGRSLACLLLSGANTDGAEGIKIAAAYGALTAIQDPETAEVPVMPRSAADIVKIDKVLKPSEIAAFINNLT
jgi:two-component system chemotaxis response regulator CheB